MRNHPHAKRYSVSLPALRAERQRAGLSLRDFARLTGVSPQSLSAVERGEWKATPWIQDRVLAAVVRLREKEAQKRERIAKAGLA